MHPSLSNPTTIDIVAILMYAVTCNLALRELFELLNNALLFSCLLACSTITIRRLLPVLHVAVLLYFYAHRYDTLSLALAFFVTHGRLPAAGPITPDSIASAPSLGLTAVRFCPLCHLVFAEGHLLALIVYDGLHTSTAHLATLLAALVIIPATTNATASLTANVPSFFVAAFPRVTVGGTATHLLMLMLQRGFAVSSGGGYLAVGNDIGAVQ